MTPAKYVAEMLDLVCVDPGRVNPQLIQESEALAAERLGKPELDRAFLSAARSLTGVLARPKRYLVAMKQITRPTLLIFGARDRLVPLAAGQAVAARRPDWKFVVHPDLGHVPQIENPTWTAQQILQWSAQET
jgi:pimeloyl-ACP methyl ester carboxylesterase